VRLADELLNAPTYHERWRHQLAVTRILDWLQTFPGDDWQTRWLLSGSDEAGKGWGPPGLSPGVRGRLTQGLGVRIVLRAVRPTYAWLSGSRLLGLYAAFRQRNQADAFAELEKQIAARTVVVPPAAVVSSRAAAQAAARPGYRCGCAVTLLDLAARRRRLRPCSRGSTTLTGNR
jgi:hypothetical protein